MPALLLILFRLGRSIWSGMRDPEFRGLFFLAVIVILSGTWFYHVREGWSWLDAFYFTVITLTTVGYGDFSPKTPEGKLFTIFYIILGLGIMSSFIILVAERHLDQRPGIVRRMAERRQRRSTGNQKEEF